MLRTSSCSGLKIHSPKGINMIELMIAVSVVGILMATAIPTLFRQDKPALDTAASMISNKLLMARQKALASKKRYRIEYNYRERSFRVLRQDSPNSWTLDPPDNRYKLPSDVMISVTSTPADGIIEIEPNGKIDPNDLPILIKLKNKENTQKSIRVSESGVVQEASTWD